MTNRAVSTAALVRTLLLTRGVGQSGGIGTPSIARTRRRGGRAREARTERSGSVVASLGFRSFASAGFRFFGVRRGPDENANGLQVADSQAVASFEETITERGRFELPLPLRADRFSKPAHSTTLPPLRS